MNHPKASRRGVAMALLGCAVGLSAAQPVDPPPAGSNYPDKPLRVIIGQAPGGSVDTVARLLGEHLGAALGQAVIVESRAGAGGMLAAEAVARSSADGYSLGLLDVGSLVLNPALQKKVSYDVSRDFTYIGTVVRVPLVLVAHPDLPASSLQALTAYAKAHPGKLSYSSSGIGSPLHLAFEDYKRRVGVFVTHVAYRGGVPALADVAAGHVDLTFTDTNQASQFAAAGKIKLLALASLTRSSLMPAVPTFSEAGVPDFEASPWVGLAGPASMPASVVTRLAAVLETVMAQPEMGARLRAMGFAPFFRKGGDFSRLVRDDGISVRALIRQQNIRLED